MKKIILSLTALLSIAFANAQSKSEGFSKGNVFVSGSVGFGSTSYDTIKSSSFSFSPKVAYFVTNNIAIGAKLGFGSSKSDANPFTTIPTVKSETSTTTFGVFGRYYATPASKFSVFGNLGFDYSSENDKLAKVKTNSFDLAVSPGVSYFLSNHFSMEATFGRLGYTSSKTDEKDAKATNTFGLDVNLSTISFGLNYKF